eukprot:TRINITY_DN4230_c0_g3_i1.p1 TRINITY_DN4230_c0_g3~~TRINITY_DN4230_c0_g3_i1.p1  ORF type:complete len:193 (-),score=51.03 TRINITY_DN4230_c0_g3_i1:99-677(-)
MTVLEWELVKEAADCKVHETYYSHWLGVAQQELTQEIIQLVSSYASGGYRNGQLVDVMDALQTWCVAEVLQIERRTAVKVHYIGWLERYDEVISTDSGKLAALFQHTDTLIGISVSPRPMKELSIRVIMEEKALKGKVTEQEICQGFDLVKCNYQDLVNALVLKVVSGQSLLNTVEVMKKNKKLKENQQKAG